VTSFVPGDEPQPVSEQQPALAHNINPAAVTAERPSFTARGAATRNGVDDN
jgi:hypothetical protein